MSANYQQATRSPLRPVYRLRIKCPVCGHKDNCSVSEDRTRAYCRRTASKHQGRDGGYLHILVDTPRTSHAPQPPPQKQAAPIIVADEARRHSVYTAFLRSLSLSAAHHADLARRGLSDEAIKGCLFRSAPTKEDAAEIARALAQDCDLSRVAGFFKEQGRWRTVWMDESILIPVRDQQARIVALMRRRTRMRPGEKGKYIWFASGEDRDGKPREGGASSGSPSNFANAHMMKDAHEVTLVEGVLKSILASHFLHQPTIGNSPSGFGANFAATLKADFPQLRTVFCAFDSDLSINIHVRSALFRLVEQLEKARFDVRIRTWPDRWKGIDNYLLAVSQGGAK